MVETLQQMNIASFVLSMLAVFGGVVAFSRLAPPVVILLADLLPALSRQPRK